MLNIPLCKPASAPKNGNCAATWPRCYRLVALYGWSDLVFTHISAKLPESVSGVGEHHFLINPYGLMFDEITASSLIKVDMQCNQLHESPFPVNPAGFVIHSAVHEARPEAGCVLHTHTRGRGRQRAKGRRAADQPAKHLCAGLAGVPRVRGCSLSRCRKTAPAGRPGRGQLPHAAQPRVAHRGARQLPMRFCRCTPSRTPAAYRSTPRPVAS